MSIAVKYSLKIKELREEDVGRVRAAADAWLEQNGWHPDVQHIKTHWDDLCWLWYASDWDTPMLVAQAVRSVEELDRSLRAVALAAATDSKPTFETQTVYPEEE